MRAAIYRVDVVRKRVDLLIVAIVVLDGDLDRKTVTFFLEIDRLIVKRRLVLVEMFDEFRNPALVVKLVRALGLLTLVFDRDPDSFVEERLFAKPLRELVEAECRLCEDLLIGLKSNLRAPFPSFSGLLQWGDRNPTRILLLIRFSITPDLEVQFLRKKVDARNTDAV